MMGFSCSCCQCKRQLSGLLGGLHLFPSVMSPTSNTLLLLCLWSLVLALPLFLFYISLDNSPNFAVWPLESMAEKFSFTLPWAKHHKLNCESFLWTEFLQSFYIYFLSFPSSNGLWSEMYYPKWCRWGTAEEWRGIVISWLPHLCPCKSSLNVFFKHRLVKLLTWALACRCVRNEVSPLVYCGVTFTPSSELWCITHWRWDILKLAEFIVMWISWFSSNSKYKLTWKKSFELVLLGDDGRYQFHSISQEISHKRASVSHYTSLKWITKWMSNWGRCGRPRQHFLNSSQDKETSQRNPSKCKI